MEPISALLAALAGLFLIAFGIFWVGLQTLPNAFTPPPKARRRRPQGAGFAPLPDDLPEPVVRYFQTIFPEPEDDDLHLDDLDHEGYSALPEGSIVPQLATVELRARGRVRLGPVLLPVRYRSEIRIGHSTRRTLEVTWFRRPLLRLVDEFSADTPLPPTPEAAPGPASQRQNLSTDAPPPPIYGRRRITGWLRREMTGEAIDRALGLERWAEALAWVPSAVAGSPARWRTVDPELLATFLRGSAAEKEEAGMDAAVLEVPTGTRRDIFLVHFNATTGLPHRLRTLKPKGDDGELTPWRMDLLEWRSVGGYQMPSLIYARWEDEYGPYAALNLSGRTDHVIFQAPEHPS